jgi:hypothetical protein
MELLDRYVNAVGKRLPQKTRADIKTELYSTLEDMLEDQSQREGRPVDEAMVQDALRNYGAPEKVAATYLPECYLIGPQIYPFFTLVLKIVFAVLGVLALIGPGIGIASGPTNIAVIVKTFSRTALQYYGGAITAFGNIVLVFAILERVLPAKHLGDLKSEDEPWDPADLMKEPEPDEIGPWEPIVTILFTFAAIVVFNFYPQVLRYTPSLYDLGSGRVMFFPLLSDAFTRYLPWLNIIWILEIALNLALLRLRRWTGATRLFSIGIKVLGMGIASAMLLGPSLLNLSAWPLEQGAVDTLAALLNQLVRVGLVVAIIATGIDVIKDLYRLFLKPARNKPAGIL